MHIGLTDVLTCPRCGPGFGLILLADSVENRRVLRGRLGCSNCREQYPVSEGLAELRWGSADPPSLKIDSTGNATRSTAGDEAALRVAALLGVTEGPARLALVGTAAGLAAAVADLLPSVEIIAVAEHRLPGPERSGVTRVWATGALPLYDASVQGVAIVGHQADRWLPEAVRVLAPAARLVIQGAESGTAARLATLEMTLLLDQEGVVVAARSPSGGRRSG